MAIRNAKALWNGTLKEGKGTMNYSDGTTLTGMYVGDAAEGVHIVIYADGTTEEFLFENGKLVE